METTEVNLVFTVQERRLTLCVFDVYILRSPLAFAQIRTWVCSVAGGWHINVPSCPDVWIFFNVIADIYQAGDNIKNLSFNEVAPQNIGQCTRFWLQNLHLVHSSFLVTNTPSPFFREPINQHKCYSTVVCKVLMN